jgi:voltage-gated potassium channel
MYQKTKGKVHILLHPELGESKADKFVNIFIISLIILNVLAVMIETIDSIHLKYKIYFDWFDRISVFIFTLEYILRVWSCTHDPRYKGSIKGRIKYMLTPGAIIDLLAFLPFYIHLITGPGSLDLRTLRILRLMRLFRLFRLTAYTKSAQMIFNVFKSRINELILSFIMVVFLVIIASCLLYFAEHNAQPKDFSSIPATLWWAVVTLTTTGYGDMKPITTVGKTLAGIIMLTGVALFALPAGIITVGFIEEFRFAKKYKGHNCPHCGKPLDEHHQHEDDEINEATKPV